ncbi:hypothetical protein DL98DRAFT_219936 [Cadophora sp. DSE1049]|nr:hypothetical protein DL98DRAFT_219936 [Cadophora sp. DSE1049]
MASPFERGRPPPQKKRRVEQACERCQRKKIRCDNGIPACSPCEAQGAVCAYSQARSRGKGKGQEYVRALEQRIENLETLLRPSTLEQARLPQPEGPPGHGDIFFGTPLPSWMPESEANDQTTVGDKDTITARLGRHQTSTASKIAQSHPLDPKNTPLPPDPPPNFLGPSITEYEFNALRHTVSDRLPGRYMFAPMVPISELARMIEVFLEDFNSTFPIFHDRSLMLLCHRKSQEPSTSVDPAWWACINAIIAMVTQSRATNSAFRKVSEISWGYFKNAFSVFEEIIAMEPSILAVQAILTMASFLNRTTDLKTAILLTSTMMRTIQLMELHEEDSSTKPSLVEAEQRRRVVWAAFLLDTTLSVKAGQPLTLDVAGIRLRLPDENSIEDIGSLNTPDVVKHAKIFGLRVRLAIVYSKAHKLLLNGHFVQDECLDLWKDLEAWEGSVPKTIRPECDLHPKPSTQDQSVLLLHLAYYECISLMHTVTDLYDTRPTGVTRLLEQPAPLSTDFPLLCFTHSRAKVARATLGMIACMDLAPFVDVWVALQSILPAAFSLVSDVFADPNDDNAIENVKLVGSLVRFLENLQRQGCDVRRLSDGCAKLLRITKSLILEEQSILQEAVRELLSVRLNSTTSYKYISQGLMTNLPKLEAESYMAAAANVFGSSEQRTCVKSPLLAPEHLMPSTYSFGVTSNRAHRTDANTENAVCANAHSWE